MPVGRCTTPWLHSGQTSNIAKRLAAAGLAECAMVANPVPMRSGLLRTTLCFLTWCCVALLAFLSLLPAQDMARTGFPGEVEHFAAYAGSAAIAVAGYGLNGAGLG